MKINKIIIEQEVRNHKVTLDIVSRLSVDNIEYIDDLNAFIKEASYQDQSSENGYSLLLAKQKGKYLGKCPGTSGHICCNYYVMHNGINCIYDCSYCFLKFYVNNPFLTVYVNREDFYKEVDLLCETTKQKTVRIGTGEFTDSLALDDITCESLDLVNYFKHNPKAIIEFKTKSNNITNLLKVKPSSNIVISWSLNPQSIIDKEEHFAASLSERLEAAAKCVNAGYKVAFHFDPLIMYDGWEDDYEVVVKKLFSKISPESIAWISMGTLRYHIKLKNEIISRFPKSKIVYADTVFGKDGKVRYFKPLRVKMYRTIKNYIEYYSKDVSLYLCMELPDVWEKVFGYCPDYHDKCDFLFGR